MALHDEVQWQVVRTQSCEPNAGTVLTRGHLPRGLGGVPVVGGLGWGAGIQRRNAAGFAGVCITRVRRCTRSSTLRRHDFQALYQSAAGTHVRCVRAMHAVRGHGGSLLRDCPPDAHSPFALDVRCAWDTQAPVVSYHARNARVRSRSRAFGS